MEGSTSIQVRTADQFLPDEGMPALFVVADLPHRGGKGAQKIIDAALTKGRSYLFEPEAKEILEGYGIRTTGGLVASSEDEAAAFGRSIGYPVVLKIVSTEVVHKTDAGGVKLNITDEENLRRAYREIIAGFQNCMIEGITVQKMAPQGIEAIIGVARDPSFGPVLMFGLGGIFVEVLKDVTFRVLPVTADDVSAMIGEIKGYALLEGRRGISADIAALKDLLLRVSHLVMEHPEIRELDLNPVFLYPEGNVACDARIFLTNNAARVSADPAPGTDLRKLFSPQSIAVLGATDTEGKLGYNVFHNLISHGFAGKLYPINPKKETVLGVKAYKSVLDVEDPIDVAVVIVPAPAAPQAVADCAAKGIRYAIIEAAGFAETGAAGMLAQKKIEEIIAQTGCRVLGPNCSGVINTHHRMVQSIGLLDELRPGNVGLIAQAGVYAAGILTGLRNIIDFGIVATIGNKMDISETDILEYMGQDDNIAVVAMYMEDVSGGRRFIDVARRTAQKKPVIVLKAGRTDAGKKAVSSHTASLAGNDEINSAVFRQSGVIRARDNEHLFSLARAFSKQPLPERDGVMVITYTGSLGVAATDTLYTEGLRLARLEEPIRKRLSQVMPDYVNVGNPVDCSFTLNPEQVRSIIEIGAQSEDVGSFIAILQGEILSSFAETFKEIDFKGKPVVCCVACKEFMMEGVIRMEQAGIPVYSTAETAAEVLGEMHRWRQRRDAGQVKALEHRLEDVTVTIDNQPIRLRLISGKDTALWTEFVNGCSSRSLWYRFLSPFSATPERAKRFCDVDPEKELAVVAEMTEDDRKKLVGIARLIKNPRCEEAEYAVIVSDPWQKKALGRILSERCVDLAKHWGVSVVSSETLMENFPMTRVLNHCQFKVETKDENMIFMSLKLK
ncbi:MAG: GNAT family N-acetyltransferase [Smithellaceae bacterium]|nr:GNAT family N-acetyltransferase [Smithellaceae bacterium]